MSRYCLTVTCPSRRGIVAAISTFLAANGCSITDSAQFDDQDTDRFFMRISAVGETGVTRDELQERFAPIAEAFDNARTTDEIAKAEAMAARASKAGVVSKAGLDRLREKRAAAVARVSAGAAA